MKRTLMVAVVVAAAVLPATSNAGTSVRGSDSAGRGGQDLAIQFTVRSFNGKPTEIKKFKFENLTATCNVGGPVDVKGKIGGSMSINDKGEFDGKVSDGAAKVLVEGDVKRGGAKVKGTIRAKGDFNAGQGCDSGKVKWEAS